MEWYKRGNATVTNGSATVVCPEANFVDNIERGEAFVGPDGKHYEISQVISKIEILLVKNYSGPSETGPYEIIPVQGYPRELAHRAADIIASNKQIAQDARDLMQLSTDNLNAAVAASQNIQEKVAGVDAAKAAAEQAAAAAAGSKDAAAASSTQANTSATSSAGSAALAQKWATQTDTEVAPGQGFGARHYANQAKASETAAAGSKTAAQTSASNAKASETAAAASKSAADAAASAAQASASNAAAAESGAVLASTVAQDHSRTASTKATEASTSAAAAAASQTAAKTSETNAKASQTAAKASETNAASSASQAATSASGAASSAAQASASQAAAAASEAGAKTSETASASSKAAAAVSASQAATSAATSSQKADTATASANAAKASETAAAGSAAAAADSKAAAGTSAAQAAASAASAAQSAANALESEERLVETIAAVQSSIADMGDLDLSGGVFPSKPSLTSIWTISVAGTVDGDYYAVGDQLYFSASTQKFVHVGNAGGVKTLEGLRGDLKIKDVLPAATAGQVLKFNGTSWIAGDDNNTTYSGMTQAESEAGTGTTYRLISPAVLKLAVLKHATGVNAASATKLETARTLTIGAASKSFDGSGNQSWSVAEIGAAPAAHGHSYSDLPYVPVRRGGGTGQGENQVLIGWATSASATPSRLLLQVDTTDFGDSWPISIRHNAATATKLIAARKINGVAFDGSADVNVPWAAVEIGSGQDLNTYLSEGPFYCPSNAAASTLLNCPTVLAFSLRVWRAAGVVQELTEYYAGSTRKTYQRTYYSNSWSPWVRIHTTIDPPLTVSGNAGSATKLETARTIEITGGAVGTATAFDGSENISIPITNLDMDKATNGTLPVGRGGTGTKTSTGTGSVVLSISPTLTGTPLAPTAVDGTNTTQLATTAFVQNAVGGVLTKTVTGGTVTLTDAEASNPVISLNGTLTSNVTLVVPGSTKRIWAVSNQTSGAFTLTVKTAAGSGVTVAQKKRNLVFTDGANVADAFNDFESIALTGVPTAPTAATTVNTTQIATTAFVQAVNSADTGSSATALKLKTARTINGVAFDGSANITVEDDTKLPLAGGTVTGVLAVTNTSAATTSDGLTGALRVLGGISTKGPSAFGDRVGVGVTPASTVQLDVLQNTILANSSPYGARFLVDVKDGALTAGRSTYGQYTRVRSYLTYANAKALGYNMTMVAGHFEAQDSIAGAHTQELYALRGYAIVSQATGGSASEQITGRIEAVRGYALLSAPDQTATTMMASYNYAHLNNATAIATNMTGVESYVRNQAGTVTGSSYLFKGTFSGTFGGGRYGLHLTGESENVMSGMLRINATTAATSTSTGALIVAGGAGFGGTVHAAAFDGDLVGNAASATKLATARTINGVAFDGTANITITASGTDATKLPLAGGTLTGNVTGPSFYASNWFRSTGASGWVSETYGGGIMMQDTTWVRVHGSKAFYVANEIASTGNITAYYSDKRLKENLREIADPLGKIEQLTGYHYNANALAAKHGYDRSKQEVGLLAQDVETVMPECVEQAPFDRTDTPGGSKTGMYFKTLKYERLVPLLIEGIKELTAQNKALMERILRIESLVGVGK